MSNAVLFGQEAIVDVLVKLGRPSKLSEIVQAAPANLYQGSKEYKVKAISDTLRRARIAGRVKWQNGLWSAVTSP